MITGFFAFAANYVRGIYERLNEVKCGSGHFRFLAGMYSVENEPNVTAARDAGLVSGPRLLELVFPDEDSRPSLRWLRDMQKHRQISFVKIGKLVRFDAVLVAEELRTRHTVRGRCG